MMINKLTKTREKEKELIASTMEEKPNNGENFKQAINLTKL